MSGGPATVTGVRLAVIRIVVVSLLLTLGARLYYLQVLDTTSWSRRPTGSTPGRSSWPRPAARSSTTAAGRW